MCGIISYVGKDNAIPYLVEGIRNLEYRGYDSFGGGFIQNGKVIIKKDAGSIDSIIQKYKIDRYKANLGLFHTRWATHGGVEKKNAHPVTDCSGDIAVVHNGIIENWNEIKKNLYGHKFRSDTDTEVIPHFLEDELKNGESIENGLKKLFKLIKGASSFVVMYKGSDKIYAIKNGSPLVFGIGKNGNFISSDVVSFIKYTNKVIYLYDGDMVVFDKDSYTIENLLGDKYPHPIYQVNLSPMVLSKGKYDHYMIKEINEQPKLLKNFESLDFSIIKRSADRIKEANRVYLLGAGTSYHAAMYGASLFRKSGIDAVAIQGQDINDYKQVLNKDDLFIIISQSGETADIISNLGLLSGIFKIGIINVEGSHLARNVDIFIPMNAGVEKAVAATKSFVNSMVILVMINSFLQGNQEQMIRDLKLLNINLYNLFVPSVISTIKKISKLIKNDQSLFYVGKNDGYLLALEGALKMKEVSYIHAEAFDLAAIKHGPLALISNKSKVISIVTNPVNDVLYGLEEIKARGGKIIGIYNQKNDLFDYFIHTPEAGIFSFVPQIIVTQLLAYYTSISKGINPDKPRNLAKSVTVK